MTELFPVEVTAPDLPIAGDRPVVFHGVNKSGSLAMANVMRDAYAAAGRSDEFISHYHKRPLEFDDFADALRNAEGPGFFVAHYIYGRIELPRNALLVTQVRHPLPRTLSVYGWIRRKYQQRVGTLADFPSFGQWVVKTKGRHHSQVANLGMGFAKGFRERTGQASLESIYNGATVNLYNDFAWCGLAERFEESIFALAHIVGLKSVPAWMRDKRNADRPALAETSEGDLTLIREVLEHEFRFYATAYGLFDERLAACTFGPALARYKERCASEYGERLLPESVRGAIPLDTRGTGDGLVQRYG